MQAGRVCSRKSESPAPGPGERRWPSARGRLAGMFGRDLPAALIEDLTAVGGAALIVFVLL